MIELSRQYTLEVFQRLVNAGLGIGQYENAIANDDIRVYINGPTIHKVPYRLHFEEYIDRGSHSFWIGYKPLNKEVNEKMTQEVSRLLGKLSDPNFSDEIFDLAISLNQKLDKADADRDKAVANAEKKRMNTHCKIDRQFEDACKEKSK